MRNGGAPRRKGGARGIHFGGRGEEGPALPARVAGKCNCIAGQGLTEGEERAIPDLARRAKVRELGALRK